MVEMGGVMRADERIFFCVYVYGLEKFRLTGLFSRRDDALAEKGTYSSGAVTSVVSRTMLQIISELSNDCHQDLIKRIHILESRL